MRNETPKRATMHLYHILLLKFGLERLLECRKMPLKSRILYCQTKKRLYTYVVIDYKSAKTVCGLDWETI